MLRSPEIAVPLMLSSVLATSGCVTDNYRVDLSKESRVTELHFEPEHTVNGMCLMKSDGFCFLYAQDTVDDEWTVTVEQCETGPRRSTPEDKCGTKNKTISEQTYKSLKVGSIVLFRNSEVEIIPQ